MADAVSVAVRQVGGAIDPTGWSDSSARAVLQLIVESVAEMIGFEVAALSVVLGDQLVTAAYTGPEEFREVVMQNDPVHVLDPVLAKAESWGRFVFLAGEDYEHDELEGNWVAPAPDQGEHPDSWDPYDVLLAVLRDDEGAMVGILSVDSPICGRRPDASTRVLLERYAAQSERAVLTAFERERLVQQVAHAEAARRLIRSASLPAHASLEAVLQHTHAPLVAGFGASGTWIQLVDGDDALGCARDRHGTEVPLPDDLADLARCLAPDLWRDQRVLVVDERDPGSVDPSDDPLAVAARTHLAGLGLASAIAVPLGAGAECLGFLVLARAAHEPAWSALETSSALEIGHDLGTALKAAAALERERALVRKLQQLDDYRTHLIATLSHELRTPLTVISGNLEMLGDLDADRRDADAGRHHDAMVRGTQRMQRVVEDLLLLARVSDPQHPLEAVAVDLREVVDSVVTLVGPTARARGLTLDVRVPSPGPVVHGDVEELDRLLTNLVSNAVKYTPSDGTVTVSVTHRPGAVLLQVADTGLGISEEDQVGLFRPFFRTTNPDALREPGTGLGLAIVATIAARHRGEVRVESRLGSGTTFVVTLPAC